MIKELYCDDPAKVLELLEREEEVSSDVSETVAKILATVRKEGDRALRHYTKELDGVALTSLEVTPEEINSALTTVDSYFWDVLEQSYENIWNYHKHQVQQGYTVTDTPGVMLGRRVIPLDRVGIYVPGGTARYPSSVLMNVAPAKLAGVGEIIMVTPPGKDGKVPGDILAAAKIAGVDRIFKLGGAQAVAALAYGTESVPKVDKIVGPGNIYVATAKQQVFGTVDIDMIAGPSEILIIADDSANPDYVAMDMLSQAEHDKLAASFLVTTSKKLVAQVLNRLEEFLKPLPKKEIAAHSLKRNGGIILTDTLETAAEISNQIAPEHLEICTDSPFSLLSLIRHAGSVFLGHYTPEALGDYFAGPNHILPTSGTARFSSGLSVDDFIKKSSFIYYDKSALQAAGKQVMTFARHEDLEAHARSVELRMEEEND